ncbi:MAG: YkgJ family cysteine cluster protein [Candidatus Sericytochromatia bacterium]
MHLSLHEQAWRAADQAQQQAQTHYPDMGCLTGCADCCQHHGSPLSYATEWAAIVDWLQTQPTIWTAAVMRYQELQANWRRKLISGQTPSLAEALFEAPCPFLAQGRCSIYPVRPTTCRAFGNTLLQQPASSGDDVYTCNREKDRWETTLPLAGSPRLALRASLFVGLEKSGAARSLLAYLAASLPPNKSLAP